MGQNFGLKKYRIGENFERTISNIERNPELDQRRRVKSEINWTKFQNLQSSGKGM